MARILIVEDSPTNMLLAVDVLESAGYIALQADNAKTGIATAQNDLPDLILMDIQLPDMDGMAATRLLKADARTATIPVMALTASAMKGDRERIMAAGFDGYIEKPIRYKEFLAAIAAVTKP